MDTNKVAEVIAQAVVGKVPQVGGLLAGLVGAFWPSSGPNLWDQIKSQVEALVSQDIAQNNLNELKLTLQGLKDDINDYLVLTDLAEKQEKLVSIDTVIVTNVPKFLNGDPAQAFSCFWGMALLHISVRHDLFHLFGGDSNKKLYEDTVKAYCYFGGVGLNGIYNDRMRQVVVSCSSDNVPGKASRWRIFVCMKDNETGRQMYIYDRLYRTGWNQQVLDEDTVECNNGLSSAWISLASQVNTDLNNWAGNAINTMKEKYPVGTTEGLILLQKIMSSSEFSGFTSQYLPNSQNEPSAPTVQLDPF